MRLLLVLSAWVATAPDAAAQAVPRRQIPPAVLVELALLEQRFEAALAADCHPERCWPKGCAYVDHAVIDRPRAASLPGLGDEAGPGSVEPQEFLTQASCAFAYEPTVAAEDAEALARRLQSKVSHGFTTVAVSRQELQPLPPELSGPPAPPAPPEPPPPPPEPPEPPRFTAALAARELWTTLLPHAAWMIAVVLLTAAATVLVWAFRRVGKETIEERAMLAELAAGEGADPEPAAAVAPADDETAATAAAWTARVAAAGEGADPEVRGAVRELLRDGDLPTLAKALLTFPSSFAASFPAGGDVAAAKLALAELVKSVDPATLPADDAFWRTWSRAARAAAIANQDDARLLRSLREDFGAPGLASLLGRLPPRPGALLFALAPDDDRAEVVRLLGPQASGLAAPLLRSERMDEAEVAHLFAVLDAARAGTPLPPAPPEPSGRGAPFDAAGALSTLFGGLPPDVRGPALRAALDRFHGEVPAWLRGVVFPDLLLALDDAARADLFLSLDAAALAAWLGGLPDASRALLLDELPRALRTSIDAAPAPPTRDRGLVLRAAARTGLARGLQDQLARTGRAFEALLLGEEGA
jgi:hypothetical protein